MYEVFDWNLNLFMKRNSFFQFLTSYFKLLFIIVQKKKDYADTDTAAYYFANILF